MLFVKSTTNYSNRYEYVLFQKGDSNRNRKGHDDHRERRSGHETNTDRHTNREKESRRTAADKDRHHENVDKSVDRKDQRHHRSTVPIKTTENETIDAALVAARKETTVTTTASTTSTTTTSVPRSRGDIQLNSVDSYAECYPGFVVILEMSIISR